MPGAELTSLNGSADAAAAAAALRPVAQQIGLAPGGKLRLEFLDGVRGVAALWVVLNHTAGWENVATNLAHCADPWSTWILGPLLLLMAHGHMAVAIFIVLSGYCLMLPVARRGGVLEGGPIRFYLKRARRILPPYYICMALCLIFDAVVSHFGKQQGMTDGRVILSNVLLLEDVIPKTNIIDGVFWSVAVEWKIYFLFPLFIWIWRRFGPLATLAVSAAIGYGLVPILHAFLPGNDLSFICPWYIFLFTMGLCASAETYRSNAHRPSLFSRYAGIATISFGVLLLCALAYFGSHGIGFGTNGAIGMDPIIGAFAASLLAFLANARRGTKGSLVETVFEARPLVYAGMMGYSIYLFHVPMLDLFAAVMHRSRLPHPQWDVAYFLVGLPVVLVACYGFYMVVERHFLNSTRKAPLPVVAVSDRSSAVA
jgi:peptidoglycan/LPS O-acetylase OafA/YrhL